MQYIITLQVQLRKKRPRDDDEDDDENYDLRSTQRSDIQGRETEETSMWYRAQKLLVPTSDWGPASRGTLTPNRTLTQIPSLGKSF